MKPDSMNSDSMNSDSMNWAGPWPDIGFLSCVGLYSTQILYIDSN